jgi:hypothetical protein
MDRSSMEVAGAQALKNKALATLLSPVTISLFFNGGSANLEI